VADDDLLIDADAILRLFRIRRALDLWVLQPANDRNKGKAEIQALRAEQGVSYRFVNFVEVCARLEWDVADVNMLLFCLAVQVTAPLFRTDKLLEFLHEYIPRRHEPTAPLVGYGIDCWFCQHLLEIRPDPRNSRTTDRSPRGICTHQRKAAVIDSVSFENPVDDAKPGGAREIDKLMASQSRRDHFEQVMQLRGLMVYYEPETFLRCTEDPLVSSMW